MKEIALKVFDKLTHVFTGQSLAEMELAKEIREQLLFELTEYQLKLKQHLEEKGFKEGKDFLSNRKGLGLTKETIEYLEGSDNLTWEMYKATVHKLLARQR